VAVEALLGAAEAAADVAKPKATTIASTARILRRIEGVTFRPLSFVAVDYGPTDRFAP
jgi:hypothetical protein